MKKIILSLVISLSVFSVYAQDDAFTADVIKMQELNGTVATQDAMFQQIVAQLKLQKPMVSDEMWGKLKKEVYDVQVAELNKKLIPIIKKHYTHEDVKGMIAFYQTPAGKKMAEKTPLITLESAQLSQTWAMGLMSKMQGYLASSGF